MALRRHLEMKKYPFNQLAAFSEYVVSKLKVILVKFSRMIISSDTRVILLRFALAFRRIVLYHRYVFTAFDKYIHCLTMIDFLN